jgi:predicted nucleic acid-binding protein
LDGSDAASPAAALLGATAREPQRVYKRNKLDGLALRRNDKVQRWLEQFNEHRCSVLDVSIAIARHAGTLRGQHAARGRVRSQADMVIAATAAQHGLTIATRNECDFDDCGVLVEKPFD